MMLRKDFLECSWFSKWKHFTLARSLWGIYLLKGTNADLVNIYWCHKMQESIASSTYHFNLAFYLICNNIIHSWALDSLKALRCECWERAKDMHRLDRQSQTRAGMIIAVYSERQECNCEVERPKDLAHSACSATWHYSKRLERWQLGWELELPVNLTTAL